MSPQSQLSSVSGAWGPRRQARWLTPQESALGPAPPCDVCLRAGLGVRVAGRMTWRVPESPCPCLPSEAVLQGRQPQQQHRQQLRAQQQQQPELWRRQQRQQHLQQEQLRLHA